MSSERARVGAVLAIAVAVLLYVGRGQVIIGDDLFYAQRLAEHPVGHVILYSNVYLLALPTLLYKLLFATVGMGPYWVYRVFAAGLSALCAWLFYRLARDRAGGRAALALTAILLVFGAGAEVIITGSRLPALMAIAAGLGAWLALAGETRRADVLASVLLTVSVTSHPSGLSFLVGAGVLLLIRPSRGRSLWILAAPVIAIAAYQLFFQLGGSSHATLWKLLAFERDSWIALVASVSGLSQVIGSPTYDEPAAQALALVLGCGVVATVILRRRLLGPRFWASLTALVVLAGATRLAPYGFLRVPDSARYLYPEAALFLLLIAEVGVAWSTALSARLRGPALAAAAVLFGAAVVANVSGLGDAGSRLRAASAQAVGQYSAYQLDARAIDPDYRSNLFLPTAGDYLAAAGAYGEVGLTPAELEGASAAVRVAADRTLVDALGLKLAAVRSVPSTPGRARPSVAPNPSLSVRRSPGCVRIAPSRRGAGTAPQALVTLPLGGGTILAPTARGTHVYAYRFADATDVALPWPTGSRAARFAAPIDAPGPPWRLLLDVTGELEVCGFVPPGAAA